MTRDHVPPRTSRECGSREKSRKQEVDDAKRKHLTLIGLASVVNVEDRYLLTDAIVSYLHGADAAAIFCAHAACERAFAAEVRHRPSAPARLDHWGLGRLLKHVGPLGLLPDNLLVDLATLNENRVSLHHYGHSERPTALQGRTFDGTGTSPCVAFEAEYGYMPDAKEARQFALDQRLRRDALAALITMFRLRSSLYTAAREPGPTQP